MNTETVNPAELVLETLRGVGGDLLLEAAIEFGNPVVRVSAERLLDLMRACKESSALDFALLVDLTAVDWMDAREKRFEVVYQLLSITKRQRLTVKVAVGEDRPEVPSVTSLWNGANFVEREVWDMFGIRFTGHPDLRRILLYEEFKGHPLRKDYPVQGKQPRIALRHPEVENTARRMVRGDLVSIRSRKGGSGSVDGQGA
jgi:NADH-quinone oxidoreductase subunit C